MIRDKKTGIHQDREGEKFTHTLRVASETDAVLTLVVSVSSLPHALAGIQANFEGPLDRNIRNDELISDADFSSWASAN